jgi:hypothetical protein
MAQTTSTATQTVTPNLFHLSGHHIHVTYTTTGIAGQPSMTYQDQHQSKSFHGDEIRTVESDLGTTVSVTLRVMPDVGSTTLTVLIPRMQIARGAIAPVDTYCITTMHSMPFVVPGTVQGQLDTYTVTKLRGTAQAVVF